MICRIDTSTEEGKKALKDIRMMVAGDLNDMATAKDKPKFVLEDYLKSIYDFVHENTMADVDGKHGMALSYAGLAADAINKIQGADETIADYLFEQNLSLDKLREFSYLYKKGGDAELKSFSDKIGVKENEADDLSEDNQSSLNSTTNTESTSTLGPVEIDQEELPPADLSQQVQKTFNRFLAAKPTVNSDQDQEVINWTDPNNVNYNVKDPLKEFYFKVKRFLLSKILSPAMDNDSSNVNIPYLNKKGVYLTLMPIKSLPRDQVSKDAGTDTYNNDDLVLVVTDVDGNPLSFDDKGEFSKDGNISYHYYRKIYPQQVDAEGRVSLYKAKSSNVIDDYDRADALKRRSKLTLEEAQEAIRQELQMIYDINKAYKKNPDLRLRSKITGGSFGFIETNSNIYTPISEMNFDYGEFAPRVATMDNSITKEKKGYTYFETKESSPSKVEIIKPTIPSIEGLQDKIVSILLDRLPIFTSFGISKNISNADRLRYLKNYVNLQGTGIQFFDDAKDGSYKVKLRGNTIYKSLPTLEFDKESDSWIEKTTDYLPAAVEQDNKNQEEARRILNEYFSTLAPQIELDPANLNLEQKSKAIQGTDPFDPETSSKFKPFSLFYNTETKKYWRVSYPIVNINAKALDSNQFFDVDVETKDGVLQFVEKEKSYVDFVKQNSFIHHPLNSNKRIDSFNAYYVFDYLPEDLDKVFKKPAVEKKPVIKEPEQTSKSVADQNNLKGIDSILDNPDFNKLMDQKNMNRKVVEEKLKEALDWWNNSPLSKTGIKLNVLFDMVNSSNPKSIANMTLHSINLYKGADYSDLYHEAFHYFTQTFLTEEQRTKLYAEAGSLPGSFTDFKGKTVLFADANEKQLEEYLAEDFREYMLSNGKKAITDAPVKKSIFRKILDFLNALFGDKSLSTIDAENNAIQSIHDIYDKLRLGNLNEYNFSMKNAPASFSVLDKGVSALDENEPISNLSFEDSKRAVDMVDSLLSKFIDDFSEIKRNRGFDSYKWTKTLLQNKDGLKAGYQQVLLDIVAVRNGLQSDLNNLNEKISSMSEEEAAAENINKQRLENQINFFDWTIKNFGDTENLMNNRPAKNEEPKGLIAYHQMKSKIIAKEYKEAFFAEDAVKEEDLFLKGREGFDRLGNEASMKELASEEILFILHGLHKKDITGKYTYVEGTETEVIDKDGKKKIIGVPELQDFDVTWNILVKTLQNTMSAESMQSKLVKLKEKRPELPITQLLNKIGPLSTKGVDEFNIWTNFYQTFNKTNVPLLQTTIELTTKDLNGKSLSFENYGYTIKAVPATGDINAIKSMWDSNFQTLSTPTKFIKKDGFGINYLDLAAVIKEFKDKLQGREIEFLNAIGIQLDDNEEMRSALNNIKKPVNAIFKAIEILNTNKNYRRKVTKPSFFAKKHFDLDDDGNIKVQKITYKGKEIDKNVELLSGESKNLNTIADLQAKYSEKWGNFQRTNAEGNTQFEHSLNSSLSIMVNAINDARSYRELISAPWMKHLDINRNFNAKASWWLKSIFDMDDYMKGGDGAKFPDKSTKSGLVELYLKNLSGVAFNKDGVFDEDKGIASASADTTTKMIMDMHMVLLNGASELMRHADKGTSYAVFLSSIKKPYVEEKNTYVSTIDFLKSEGEFSRGDLIAFQNSVLPSLAAELSRIQDFRSKQEQIDDAKKKGLPSPVQNIDFNYFKRGQAFVTFRDMLTPEMKIKLIKEVKGDLLTYLKSNPQLEKELRLNLKQYFDKETDRIIKDLIKIGSKNKRGNIISDNVFDNLQKKIQENQLNVDPKGNAAKKALVRTYVVNTWIHNMESINLIYGDTALYNMAKEEFHKRNAGVSSTGTIYRTDKAALDYVNTVLKRGYLSEEGIEDKYGPFNGTMNTAVVKDNEIPSKYIEIYAKALIEDLKDRNKISDLEARKQILGYDEKTNEVGTYDKLYKNGKLHAYYKMNEGDAQGWITLDSYRILLNLEGQWSKSQENLYQKIIKKEPVLEKDVIETFPPQKLQYWGPLNTEGLPVNAFHKFSLLPLVPNVIKGTSLEDLHNKMVKEGVDYALFQSGSKVGTITKDGEYDKLYSDDNRTISSEPFTKNSIFLNYLKNQLNIAPKYKNKVTFSTQLRKLIENGLIENGVPTDFKGTREQWDDIKSEAERKRKSKNYTIYKKYEDNLKLLTKQKKEELLEEMDWKMVSGVPKGSIEDLVKFVRKELTREDLAQHEIDFVDLASGGKKLKHDLSMSSSANKIEKLLNSIVTNRLIKQKINGEGLIQISGAGFETKNAWLGARAATEEELKKWGTNDLPTYYKKADGTTAAMKVKVALQGNFKKLLNLKDVNDLAKERQIPKIDALNILIKDEKWLDKEDNRKLLTMVGVRIPVQGINSAEFMEVYEFLPENAGNIIVPPAEIVAKSGSDFDIDKLTVMMPNIGVYNNEVKLIKFDPKNKRTKKDIQESLNKAYENKLNIKIMYEEWFKEDKESKAFKVLTEEEKALIEKLKQEYGSRLKEINDQLNPLKDSWEKLRREQGAKYYTSSEFLEIEEQIINLTAKKESLFKDFSDNKEFYKSTFYSDKVRQLREKEEQDIQKANEEIAKLKEELDATSTKGIENDLLFNIKEMLELPSNFVALITPNSTDIAQPIADDLSYFVNQYNQKDNLMGTASKDQLDFLKEDPSVMSGTRVLEVGYNLFKHANNNIGKAVLGIGAVDNTMNAIFNRVGAYMNPTAIVRYSNNKKTTKVRQTILADHNKMMVDGKECISLSDLYDYNKENSISDVISQLINGWVDVAKDAWIFNLQGNREITPTLLFMVQAGVPLRTAVYMVSQPIIREYVEEQRLRQSTFSPIMGNESKSRGFIQFDAKKKMLEKYFPEKFILSDEAKEEAYVKNGSEGIEIATNALFSKPRIQEFTVDETDRAFRDNNNKMNPSTLYKNIVDYKEDPNKEISDYEKAVLLHYFELEDMAKAVKDVKKAMNFDTSKDSNIFEAQNRTAIIAKLKENDRIPTDIVDKILENSPISSFYISEFQTQIWEPLFKLRNHEVFNQFIIDKMGNQQFYDDVQSTFGDSESFVNSFRNDLISMIYQNALKDFDIRNIKSYKGQLIIDTNVKEAATTVEQLSYLGIGVFVKDGTIYLDKKTLANQFDKSLYATEAYENLGLAKVSLDTFDSANEYFHFVFEREYLRNMYKNVSSLENNPEFQALYQNLLSDLQKNDLKKRELVKVSRPIKKVAKANPLTEAGVKPTDMYGNAAKDIQMAQEAIDSADGQFIGYGTVSRQGTPSSTNKYAAGWGFKANTGKYSSNSVIMVSSSGTFGRGGVSLDEEAPAIKTTFLTKYKPLLDEAVKAGASFRIGNNYEKGVDKDTSLEKIKKGEYFKGNYGDALVAEYLKAKGYTEEKLDGYSRWTSPTVEPLVEPTEDSYEVTEEAQKIYSALGNKTIAGKVVLKPLSELSNKGGILPDGNINALRNSKSNEHFGNPYDSKDTSGTIRTASTKESVERFINWVLNGDFVKQSRKVNDQDIAMFNSYVAKSKKLPTEFFTTNSTFKEFYNNETGRREKAPQTSLWMINDNNRYDLIDQVTGEVYISDVDLRNGYQYEEVQPARRQWIRNQLKSGELKNKDILYYTELNEPSHATALDYLINKYDWDIADPINKVKKEAFETFLRDKALTNIYNNAALFKGDNTFADKLNIIKTKFAEDDLLEKYPVLKVLGTNTTIVNKKDRYSNIQLIGNLNDTEELNSFYEQMLDLQNPTVKKVEDPEANKFISEFFTKLTHVAFLQSGLNTNTKFSFTRLMPQDGYIRLMEKPVKDATQKLSYNFLESYYKMFVSQNSITRKALKDRFKDYVMKPTFTTTISKEEAESMITTQSSGGMVYKASKIMNAQYAQELLSENSDLIFVYPDAFLDKSTAIGGKNDQAFKNLPQSNKIGSPDARYSINNTTVSSLIKDENGGPNKEIVDKIDEMVKAIVDSGKIPIFSSNGYGQAWISNVPEDAKSQPVIDAIRTKYTAPQTFLYLSKVLYEKFGYVNKNYDRTTAGKKVIQSKQPISDEQVLEFMRKCYLS